MDVHYTEVRKSYHQVPIPVLVGPSNTGKSLLAKVAASLMKGLKEGIFHNSSMSRLVDLMGSANFFVYNDSEKTDVLKALIRKLSSIVEIF